MNLIHPRIDLYLDDLSGSSDPVLTAMEKEASRRGFPIVGPQVGRVLFQLTVISGARRILELGSGFGYSAIWFAHALGKQGELILTEYSAANLTQASSYLDQAGVSCKLDFHEGDAREIVKRLEGDFDLIFMDVDKSQYPRTFPEACPSLRQGGLFVTDNVLWSGRVLDPEPDRDTRGVVEFTRMIYENPQFFSTILPIRDGVSVSLRIAPESPC